MHELITLVAKYFLLLSLAGTILVAYRIPRNEKMRFVLLVIAGGIISLILAKISSHFINDPRPFVQGHFTPLLQHAPDNGFPSDHTLLAAFLGFAAWLKSRKTGVVLLALAALIGLSRMAAGVHHSWDILGSFVIAAVGCYAANYLLQHLPAYFRRTKTNTVKP
jgi:undecaprenyl-diphosphatase